MNDSLQTAVAVLVEKDFDFWLCRLCLLLAKQLLLSYQGLRFLR